MTELDFLYLIDISEYGWIYARDIYEAYLFVTR